uniref:Ground-like domain-containing protein n=1 Tax=Panagrellus redivivus TaxID=6233 RepID=A0A7E4VMD3_PANRE
MSRECHIHLDNDLLFEHTCCYKASSQESSTDPECNLLTVLARLKNNDDDDGDATIPASIESTAPNTGLGVHENADKCEQSHMGQVGKISRRCYPGGHGCFHLKRLNDANEAVIASCIGRAEEMVATREDAFERYHEALVCLTEEAQDKCHLVVDGIRMRYVCCCSPQVVRNYMASCEVDSNMLFNTNEYAVKYVGDFKDDNGDD